MDDYIGKTRVCKWMFPLWLLSLSTSLFAQADSVSLSINEADKRFLDSNLNLLALHYNVDANKAFIEQAKLWPNPVLSTDQNVYSNSKFFEHGKDADGNPTGQYFIQLQQLILTAGKRGKQVNLAATNARISELQLRDLLRNLRLQLHIDYYTVSQSLENNKLLNEQLVRLRNLQNAMQAQYKAGNIAYKDYLRIQALVINLQQDITDVNRNLTATEEDLKMLLRMPGDVFVKPSDSVNDDPTLPPMTLENLVQTARQNNAYYLLQQSQQLYASQNTIYQKALRSPDVTVGPEFDKNSNYTPNYVGLSVNLPLPLWNRNQGNIKAAEFTEKQQQTEVQSADVQLQTNIAKAYRQLLLLDSLDNDTQKEFYKNYRALFNNVVISYQQRQISLLEFLDFADSYQQAQTRLLQQQSNLQLIKEQLNYEVGTDVIK